MDHCKAIDLIFHYGQTQATYNVGGSNEKTNIEIAEQVCEILDELAYNKRSALSIDSFKDLITFTEDRRGHDRRYAAAAGRSGSA